MTRNRLFGAVLILIIGTAVVLGGMLGIAPKLEEIQATTAQREVILAKYAEHEADLIVLKQDFAGIAELRTYLATLQSGVPLDAGIPDFLDELEIIARQNSVTLDSLVISDAVAFQPAAEPVIDSSAVAASGTGVDSAAVASAVPAISSALTADNYLAVSVALTIAGAHSNLFDFVAGLQHGQRSIAISSVATDTGAGEIVNDMTVLGTIYVLLDPDGVALEH